MTEAVKAFRRLMIEEAAKEYEYSGAESAVHIGRIVLCDPGREPVVLLNLLINGESKFMMPKRTKADYLITGRMPQTRKIPSM